MAPLSGRSPAAEAYDTVSSSLVLIRRATTDTSSLVLGAGSTSPNKINNKGFFALFGLLGAGMVLGSIWFFFWAKNGGFIWRENDWDDYKSTVLRRKDKNGKTLSNATPRTNHGQDSIAGTFDQERDVMMEKKKTGRGNNTKSPGRPEQGKRERSDDDVRAYRHEKPAKVGGLNRQHDGSHFDYPNVNGSDLSNNSRVHLIPNKPVDVPPKKKGFMERKREKKPMKRHEKERKPVKPMSAPARTNTPKVRPVERRPSLTNTEMTSVADTYDTYGGSQDTRESYFAQYRPQVALHAAHQSSRHASPHRHYANSPSHSRQPSPAKAAHLPRPPGSYDAYSDAGSSDRASTRYNTQHIPQFSRGTGFRRDGGYGRRDSLSDSDGDLGSMR